MRIYVIGPVSGHADLNLPAFEDARIKLREAGFVPLIPHDFVPASANWQDAMRRSLECIAKADGIAYLEGVENSNGAMLEYQIATALGIRTASVAGWCITGNIRARAMHKETKLCPKCKRILPLLLFDKATLKADGKQAWCRDCMKSYKREQA